MAQAKPINKILTGNRLRTGDTVYYTPAGEWSAYVSEAKVVTTPEGVEELDKIGKDAYAANLIVDVNVIDVLPGAGANPSHIREVIRATGPTVRTDQ